MTLRDFLGKARQKILLLLFGKNLYAAADRINILENYLDEQSRLITEQRGRIDHLSWLSSYRAQKYAPESKHPEILSDWYRDATGKNLDLNNPRTFNEKIQWLKLYDSTLLKTRLADKFLVRDWVKEKIGERYLVPLLGVYDNFSEINFEALPNQFVIKATHGSAMNLVVFDKEKLIMDQVKDNVNSFLNVNFAYKAGLELHYRNIKPRIIVEKFLKDDTEQLNDYRFVCFSGKPKYICVDTDKYINCKRNIYDLEWNLLPFTLNYPNAERILYPPVNLKEMIDLAKRLCNGFNHVRVDLYSVNSEIYFGEMTFTSLSGIGKFTPDVWDAVWGDMITLPAIEKAK